MGDLGSKAESVIVAQFVRLGVAERVRRLSALYEETTAAAAPVSIEDENKTKQDKNVVQNIIAEAGPSDDSEVDPGIEVVFCLFSLNSDLGPSLHMACDNVIVKIVHGARRLLWTVGTNQNILGISGKTLKPHVSP